MARHGRLIRVTGQVQGVGFRPHVWRQAQAFGISGHVLNDGGGVLVQAWGEEADLAAFVAAIAGKAPPMAQVAALEWQPLSGEPAPLPFVIVESGGGAISTALPPDTATCPACLAEIFDPADRRYGYAFTNCTHCGPRLSIVTAMPYDRASTAMVAFPMCAACTAEYRDPADRRFHAQPNACPACGPRLWMEGPDAPIPTTDPIALCASRLRAGDIVAIKGIGGFHLACDATNPAAVARLRRAKHRPTKPLALLARDAAQIRRFASVSAEEEALLSGPSAPIVLVCLAGAALPQDIAPGLDRVGVMLPQAPLHHLLMAALDAPLVLTSGNPKGQPQVIDNTAARLSLRGIADLWLMHDRDIVNRLDDSIVRADLCGPALIRRGRGFAPGTIGVPFEGAPAVLAMGGALKSTFCLLRDGQATLSQHLGDLEDAACRAEYRRTIGLYRDLFRFDAERIVVDLHPDYGSTLWGRALAEREGLPVLAVQHHHAHMAGCLAEHGLMPGSEASVGIILDGLGLGPDSTIWGGEILVGGYAGVRRAAHLPPVPLPGGDQAMRQPWRNLLAHLVAAFGPDWQVRVQGINVGVGLKGKPIGPLLRATAQGLNAPHSSSAGRLFDAVAAALGLCFDAQTHEAEAAMALEALAVPHLARAGAYPVDLKDRAGVRVFDLAPMWAALIGDLRHGVAPGVIAARFHLGLVAALAHCAAIIAGEEGLDRIVLSGGVMQNRILREHLYTTLTAQGLRVLVNLRVPANDGGLSLGQAAAGAVWQDGVIRP